MAITEAKYQAYLILILNRMFPGCVIIKNDSSYLQGILDLTILYENKWALIEVKRSADANVHPKQEYFVELLDGMSFAAIIFPENEEEVLSALQQAFKPPRRTRVSKSKSVSLG